MAQPMVAHFLAQTEGFCLKNRELVMVDFGLDADGRTERLAQASRALRDAQLLTGWRDELRARRAKKYASLAVAAATSPMCTPRPIISSAPTRISCAPCSRTTARKISSP